MDNESVLTVIVSRCPTQGLKANREISVDIIRRLKWTNASWEPGGSPFPYLFIKGNIPYELAMGLGIASGSHVDNNDGANVSVLKCNNTGKYLAGYNYLSKLVGAGKSIIISRPKGEPPCTKKMLEILNETPLTRGEVRKLLLKMGYEAITITHAIKRLNITGRITIQSHNNPQKQVLTAI